MSFSVTLDTSKLDLDGVAEVAVDRAMRQLQHTGISIAQRVVGLGSTLNKPMYSRRAMWSATTPRRLSPSTGAESARERPPLPRSSCGWRRSHELGEGE